MRFDIQNNALDIRKLDRAIDDYRCENCGEIPSYIVINNETMHTLHSIDSWVLRSFKIDARLGIYTAYKGIPLAVCDNLQFGEVDII